MAHNFSSQKKILKVSSKTTLEFEPILPEVLSFRDDEVVHKRILINNMPFILADRIGLCQGDTLPIDAGWDERGMAW
jgi:hypothetical protein